MNIALWILQFFLAFHTAVGAVWKLSNSEQSVPSLGAIPHGVWVALSAVEIICAIILVAAAFVARAKPWVPLAAGLVAAEMLMFVGVHLASGDANHGQMIYWLVAAALSATLAYARRCKPTGSTQA